jgi:hypothetical protein
MKKLDVLKTKKSIVLLVSLLVLGVAGANWMTNPGLAQKQGQGRRMVIPQTPARPDKESQEPLRIENNRPTSRNNFTVDIAENGTRFVFDDTPVDPGGNPLYGNEFITEGYIYPGGTLNGSNGTNMDGSPEFPDLVIGRWTCRGRFVGIGALTPTGPNVITHQLFDFDETFGNTTLTNDGFELADFDVVVKRAVTGGTGVYSKSRGEADQILLGFPNASFGVDLRVTFKLAP